MATDSQAPQPTPNVPPQQPDLTGQPPKRNRWSWVWKTFLLVLVVLLVVYISGYFLPDTYHAELHVRYAAPPAAVWVVLQNPQEYPVSGDRIKEITFVSKKTEKTSEVWIEDRGSSQIRVTVLEQKPWKWTKRKLEDSAVTGMTAEMEIALAEDRDGTLMRAKQTITIENATWHTPIFRVMLYLFNGAEWGLKSYCDRIGEGVGSSPKYVVEQLE